MSFDAERLFNLLPAVYRLRDVALAGHKADALTAAEHNDWNALQALLAGGSPLTEPEAKRLAELEEKQQRGPLKALLALIAEQAAVLEEDLEQLYDDQFIETCAEWVTPYIGDLVGARGLFVFPDAQFSQRAQVANTLAYRRRKGTASVLEQLARDVTAWDASVVEYFQLLATTQYLNHLRPGNLSVADLRHSARLDYINTPFDSVARTADVRNIESRRGKYNIPNVGIFLWRLGSYSTTAAPAHRVDSLRFLFDALGKRTQLYNKPVAETEITHLAEPVNVPMPLRRRVLDRDLETYYGDGKSILIYRDGVEVPIQEVCVCDLSDVVVGSPGNVVWAHMPQNKVAIDPVLGRIAFPPPASPPSSPPQGPPQRVHVTYHHGFSAAMGGGEYDRAVTAAGQEKVIKVPKDEPDIPSALAKLVAELTGNPQLDGGVVELEKPALSESDYHILSGGVTVPAGKKVTIRAGDEHRPVILLSGDWQIGGGANASFELNGLLISGGGLIVPAGDELDKLRLSHCTIAPSNSAALQSPPQTGPRALVINSAAVEVEADHCILGPITAVDTARVCLTGCIVDAGASAATAYAGTNGQAGAPLVAINCTIIGRVHTLMMELASNTIFFADADSGAPALAERLQEGCVRFCYVPPGSRLPRQFECKPESPEDAARVRPVFTSLRYGDAGYCQLGAHCHEQIKQGADDGAEIGAFHNLHQPQRVANLRARLDEYLRFGLEAGIFEAS